MSVLSDQKVIQAIRVMLKKSKRPEIRVCLHLDTGTQCIYWVGKNGAHTPERLASMYSDRVVKVSRGDE